MVEQRPLKAKVVGSCPTWPTSLQPRSSKVEQPVDNRSTVDRYHSGLDLGGRGRIEPVGLAVMQAGTGNAGVNPAG